uniref:SCP domain-containing protein n=1 Tax=Ascaris lumbricoides TaxID=6252 RepID=A0A0M3IM61_ASCLU
MSSLIVPYNVSYILSLFILLTAVNLLVLFVASVLVGASPYALPDSSTSEDSLDSVSTAIRCNSTAHPSGYLSEGESLLASGSNFPELSIADVSNGYVSEGGITIYARKMQARFREGLEAVRDSMRHRHHDYNDRYYLNHCSDVSNGYVSEGGITIYARKMQARFREGLEAVRDSMRHRHHDYNDRYYLNHCSANQFVLPDGEQHSIRISLFAYFI